MQHPRPNLLKNSRIRLSGDRECEWLRRHTVSPHLDCDHHTQWKHLRMRAIVRLYVHTTRVSHKTVPYNKTLLLFTTHSPFILGIAVLFWAAAHHGLNSYPPLGKPSKWHWLYPPSTPHLTRAARFPHSLPKRVCLLGMHWHRTGWRLVRCTLRFSLQMV